MIYALRWAATRAILMCVSFIVRDIVTTSEEKGEPKRTETEALLLTSLMLYRFIYIYLVRIFQLRNIVLHPKSVCVCVCV